MTPAGHSLEKSRKDFFSNTGSSGPCAQIIYVPIRENERVRFPISCVKSKRHILQCVEQAGFLREPRQEIIRAAHVYRHRSFCGHPSFSIRVHLEGHKRE